MINVSSTTPGISGIPYLAIHPFRDGSSWSILLINRHRSAALEVRLELPFTPFPTAALHWLTAPDIWTGNETEERVTLVAETRTGVSSWSELSLPPFSAVVVAVREADLFADGFESGDVAAWSGAARLAR